MVLFPRFFRTVYRLQWIWRRNLLQQPHFSGYSWYRPSSSPSNDQLREPAWGVPVEALYRVTGLVTDAGNHLPAWEQTMSFGKDTRP